VTAIAGALSWYAHKDDARALGRVEAWEVEESVSVERGTVAAARAAAWARAEERSELERGGAVLVIAQGAGPGGAGPLLLSVRGAAEPGAGQLPDGAARPHAAAARQWADAIGVGPVCRAPAGSAAHLPAAGRAARATRAREALSPPALPPPPFRTDWTRLVPPPVLNGHALSQTQPPRRANAPRAAAGARRCGCCAVRALSAGGSRCGESRPRVKRLRPCKAAEAECAGSARAGACAALGGRGACVGAGA
jgi:hypothetical protein